MIYGKLPEYLGKFDFDLSEVMYYLYLPVIMNDVLDGRAFNDMRLPGNVECCDPLVYAAITHAARTRQKTYKYAYLSARKGVATPGNALNRPGWHADGFGTDDLNYVWWVGPGTRFAYQPFEGISDNHLRSLEQFEWQVKEENIITYPERGLYCIDPTVVHATPVITETAWRQYIKVSLSDHKYNLENNSHNYLFDYKWPMTNRDQTRNDPSGAQRDYA